MTELRWKAIARVQFEGDAHAMEDTCGFAGAAAWTVDGATSLLEPLGLPGPSDPAWLAETLSLYLAEAVAEAGAGSHPSGTRGSHPSGIPSCERQGVRALLAAALTKVDDVGRRWVGEERVRFPSAAVSVAVLNEDGVEVLSLADCHVVVRLAGGGIEHVMSQLADSPADSTTDSSAHSRVDSSPDSSAGAPVGVPVGAPVGAPAGGPRASLPGGGRAAPVTALFPEDPQALSAMVRNRERRNTEGGLWVARRETEAADRAHVVQLGHPALMVIASDGAWRAVDLGLVSGPEEFLSGVSTAVGALELMHRLRAHQQDIGEVADDATVLVLAPASSAVL